MDIPIIQDKPCLVQTGQGLSVLYKERYLYSRYNPAAAIERLVDSIELRENTLILCFSPVLGYGLARLSAKLKSGCCICVIEADTKLFELYEPDSFPNGTLIIAPKDVSRFSVLLQKRNATDSLGNPIPEPGTFRRCIRLDLSAAPSLKEDTYRQIQQNTDSVIASFWKNRLTLIKMGRLYHRNLFRNLGILHASKPFGYASIYKPIIVVGAGLSADKIIYGLAQLSPEKRQNFYIIAVDAALGAMLEQNIRPDAAVAVECQFAIQKAYYGSAGTQILLFADITSRPAVLRRQSASENTLKNCTGGSVVFFISEFADTGFMETVKKIVPLPPVLPPLGSVGLAATELALRLRATPQIPVFVTGLDFAFIAGKTHCKGSPHIKQMLEKQNRLLPEGNPASAYRNGAYTATGKTGAVVTDPALAGYHALFKDRYASTYNLYDLECTGLPLGLPEHTLKEIVSAEAALPPMSEKFTENAGDVFSQELKRAVQVLYDTEEKALKTLKAYLINGGATETQILELLENREYLYQHFPDGFKVSTEITFLKRIRAEIDFFLKDMELGRKDLKRYE